MSANVLKFKFIKEVDLDKNLNPTEEETISLYACTDGISAYVATVKSTEEARELIQPNNIDIILDQNVSYDESEVIQGVLNYHPEYFFYDEVYNYKDKNKEE